ncbi:hypothetical protein BaRGS_00009418, partial [Batillaria attramentaria]
NALIFRKDKPLYSIAPVTKRTLKTEKLGARRTSFCISLEIDSYAVGTIETLPRGVVQMRKPISTSNVTFSRQRLLQNNSTWNFGVSLGDILYMGESENGWIENKVSGKADVSWHIYYA